MRLTPLATTWLAVCLATCPGGRACAEEPSRADRILAELHDPSGRVLVVAHRGDWRNFPENSLRAIESAIEIGCDIVEIDIRVTQDGRYVAMHDKTLARTTTGRGKVSHHSLDQVRRLRLKNGYGVPTDERVPTLEEALLACRGRALLYVDKSEQAIADVYAIARRCGMERHVLFFGHRPAAELDQTLGPLARRIVYLPKLGDNTADPAAYLEGYSDRSPAVVASFSSEDSPAPRHFGLVRRAGMRVWASPLWPELCAGRTDDLAVDDPASAWGWLLDRGVSILCTDRPAPLIAYLDRRAAEAGR